MCRVSGHVLAGARAFAYVCELFCAGRWEHQRDSPASDSDIPSQRAVTAELLPTLSNSIKLYQTLSNSTPRALSRATTHSPVRARS